MDKQRAIRTRRQLAVALLLAVACILSLVVDVDSQRFSLCHKNHTLPDIVERNIRAVFKRTIHCSTHVYRLIQGLGRDEFARFLRNIKRCDRDDGDDRHYTFFMNNALTILHNWQTQLPTGKTKVDLFNPMTDEVSSATTSDALASQSHASNSTILMCKGPSSGRDVVRAARATLAD